MNVWLLLGNMLTHFNFQNVKSPPKRDFVRTIWKKIKEEFENFRLGFVGKRFEILAPTGSNVNENEKYS